MRVLHVFSTFGPGGPQVRTAALMRGLGEAFQHGVVAMDGRADTLELCPGGVRLLERPAGLRGMRALLARERPDLLCTYNWGAFDALLAARLEGRRSHLHHEDGFNADEAGGRKRRRNLARRLVLGRAERVIVPSSALAGIAEREWGISPGRIALVVNGVDTELFRREGEGRAELRAELGIDPAAVVLGAVGHLRPIKRYDRLLRAAAGLDLDLILVGDGPERERLAALAGPRVHLVGHQRSLAPWYRAMDIFCISSDSEQLPITQLEAMASGLPICGTAVGDVVRTAPKEGRDLFVPPGEPASLRSVIESLLGDPPRRTALGRSGAERARELYSQRAMVAAYRDLYLAAGS